MINVNDKNTLDLGCGTRMRTKPEHKAFGVDISVQAENVFNVDLDYPARLKDIFPDAAFDEIYAYDLLEHIDTKLRYDGKLHFPRIELFNTVWDLLKTGGLFTSFTPYIDEEKPSTAWAQDPTHTAVPWTKKSFNYFTVTPGWEYLQQLYGIKCRFQLVDMQEVVDQSTGNYTHLLVTLCKP